MTTNTTTTIISTDDLIAAIVAPQGEPNWYDYDGEIAAMASEAAYDELARRVAAGDPVAVSYQNRADVESIGMEYTNNRCWGGDHATLVANIAEAWGWTQAKVQRALDLSGVRQYR